MANADEKTGIRLQQFLSAENISQAQFADSLGITRASISHILAGRNKPSFDFLFGVLDRYPNLSLEWLISGKGKMYKTPGAELFAPEQAWTQTSEQAQPQSSSTAPSQGKYPSGLTANPAPVLDLSASPDSSTGADSVPATENGVNTRFPEGSHTPLNTPQKPVNQRRISKIVVFYDDGTYKELK